MSDCICGHLAESHYGMRWCECAGCVCQLVRPVLDWPDSEGNWWCHNPVELVESEAFAIIGGIVEEWCVHCKNYTYHRDDWEDEFGPARFVKLTEPNPFEKEPR